MKFLQFTYQYYFQIVTPRKWNEISYIKSRPFLLDLEESRLSCMRFNKISIFLRLYYQINLVV